MKASDQCKQAGLKSLAQLSDITGCSVQTLTNWHKSKPLLFSVVIAGAVSLLDVVNSSFYPKYICNMDITVQAQRALINAGIETVSVLLFKTELDLLKIPKFGKHYLAEVVEEMREYHLFIGMNRTFKQGRDK